MQDFVLKVGNGYSILAITKFYVSNRFDLNFFFLKHSGCVSMLLWSLFFQSVFAFLLLLIFVLSQSISVFPGISIFNKRILQWHRLEGWGGGWGGNWENGGEMENSCLWKLFLGGRTCVFFYGSVLNILTCGVWAAFGFRAPSLGIGKQDLLFNLVCLSKISGL